MSKGRKRLRRGPNVVIPPAPLFISGTFPNPVLVGEAVNFIPTFGGGVAPLTITSTGTALPADLALNGTTGAVTGDVAVEGTTSGVILTVNDSAASAPAHLSFDIIAQDAAPPSDLTVPISTTDRIWLTGVAAPFDYDSTITAWLDTINDNDITCTIAGDIGDGYMQVWGYYEPQVSGETKMWVDRELREYLEIKTDGATVGNRTITLSAMDGPNETGSLSTFVITLAVQAGPVLTFDVGTRVTAGTGGVMLDQVFGTGLGDWVLDTQSDLINLPLALWDGTTTSARISWASTGATPTTNYMGTKKVASPTQALAAYTATVSSVSRGVSGAVITLNTDKTNLLDWAPCPARDSTAAGVASIVNGLSFNQWGRLAVHGDSAGNLYCGDRLVGFGGTLNPTYADQTWIIKQPTSGGGYSFPTAPYGADDSWDYEDHWNPAWLTTTSRTPDMVAWPRGQFNVTALTLRQLGYRLSGLNINREASTSGAMPTFSGQTETVNGAPSWFAVDHCLDPTVSLTTKDYHYACFLMYNDCDNERGARYSGSPFGTLGQDIQICGNVFRHMVVDIINSTTYCSVVGNGRTKTSWNLSIDKKLEFKAHSDFYQTNAVTATQYKALLAGSTWDWGEWVGNWCTKGKGELFTAADVGYVGLFFQADTVSGAGWEVGEVITGQSGVSGTVISLQDFREIRVQLTNPAVPFPRGDVVTGANSLTTGVTNGAMTITGIVASGGGIQVGSVISGSGGKTAEVLKVNSSTSYNIKMLTGTLFVPTTAITVTSGPGVGTTGNLTSVGGICVEVWAGGTPQTADIGKTTGDCQGLFNNAPQAPLTSNVRFRSDIFAVFFMAGWLTEGLDSYGIYRPPPMADDPDAVIVNCLVTPPWGTISEVGTGGYYDKGRYAYIDTGGGLGTIIPAASFCTNTLGSKTIGRNVFMCGNGFNSGATLAGATQLVGSDFGSPTNSFTTVPTQVTDNFQNPTNTATRNSILDIIESYSPVPGGILTTQGTDVDFGLIVPEIDYRRHIYDRAALMSLA